LVTLAGCSGGTSEADPEQTQQVRVSGSATAVPLVAKLAEEYSRTHPQVRFTFDAGSNSGGAIDAVQAGSLDLAVVNRELEPQEEAGGVAYRSIARDAVAFAVDEDSQLSAVNTRQVRDVYGGRIRDFAGLGSPPRPIVVLDRDADDSARKLVLLPVMGTEPVAAEAAVLAKASEMTNALSGTRGAFGYTAVGYLKISGSTGIRLLALDSVEPTADNVVRGDYPWSLTFGLVTGKQASPELADFVTFSAGPEASDVLTRYGYAPPKG